MHIGHAAWEHKVKDLWIMYLQYMGRDPEMVIIEQASFDDKKASEEWAKDRERYWISHHDQRGADLLNEPQWSGHASRKSIPRGIKMAWCETHALLWDLDRNWKDELRLLEYLNKTYGRLTKEESQPNGSVLCETMAEISFAKFQYQRRRFRTWSVLRALLAAHPSLAIGDLDAVNLTVDN
jgi:hypothetical protein